MGPVNSKVETLILTPDIVKTWKPPPFQRPLTVNYKVEALAETLKSEGGVMPAGTPIQLGIWEKDTYLVDGQHRIAAFLLSELEEMLAEVSTRTYEDGQSGLESMASQYMMISTKIVQLKPDDMLRAFESLSPQLQCIRKNCPFVGYAHVRRGDSPIMVSMSAALRCWSSSEGEAPTGGGRSTVEIARDITQDDSKNLSSFLIHAFKAWGVDPCSYRLWSNLNLTVCMWIYRRIVLDAYSLRSVRLTPTEFEHCLMSLAADESYTSWLIGRALGERDRGPCYSRIKAIFLRRIKEETGKKQSMPSPSWGSR